jgi:hypothetical protein
MSGSGARDLETALDELYAVDPSDFMATRKQLVADLRAAGDRGAAKQVGAARRPTNAAWALNQLARRHGDLIDQFLEQSRALRDAQDQAVSGRPDELRSATRAQREALAAVTQAANRVLGNGMTEAYRSQIAATLQAASVDDATAAVLRQGRVIREVSGATGFPDAGGLSLADVAETTAARGTRSRLPRAGESGDTKARESDEPSSSSAAAAAAAKASERRARAEAELATAEASLRDAEDELASAEDAATAANERVETLREELERARQEARAATEAVNDARRAAKDTAKAVERVRRTVEKLS